MLVPKDKLAFVGEIYNYTEMNEEYDAYLYFDPATLRFVVVEGHESARPPSASRYESGPSDVGGFLQANPEYRQRVVEAIVERLRRQ